MIETTKNLERGIIVAFIPLPSPNSLFFERRFHPFKGKKDYKGKSNKEPQTQSQGVKCLECGGNEHVLMREILFLGYLRFEF